MTASAIATVAGAGVATLALLITMFSLAYRMGVLNGTVIAFMAQAETHRTEVLKELGALDDRLDRHIELHHEGRR